MFELKIGQAIIAVESSNCERLCSFYLHDCKSLPCSVSDRKDGKSVIFKVIDLPVVSGGSTGLKKEPVEG